MAKFVYGLNQSLDGYVDHDHQQFAPSPSLFRRFIEQVRGLTGSLYGRRMYEVMRYWDEDLPEWGAEERDFAAQAIAPAFVVGLVASSVRKASSSAVWSAPKGNWRSPSASRD